MRTAEHQVQTEGLHRASHHMLPCSVALTSPLYHERTKDAAIKLLLEDVRPLEKSAFEVTGPGNGFLLPLLLLLSSTPQRMIRRG